MDSCLGSDCQYLIPKNLLGNVGIVEAVVDVGVVVVAVVVGSSTAD